MNAVKAAESWRAKITQLSQNEFILVANFFVCIFGTHFDNDKTYDKDCTDPLAELSITLCI